MDESKYGLHTQATVMNAPGHGLPYWARGTMRALRTLVLALVALGAATAADAQSDKSADAPNQEEFVGASIVIAGGGLWPAFDEGSFSTPTTSFLLRFAAPAGTPDILADLRINWQSEEGTKETWGSMNIGLQLKSRSTRALFRPRAGIAPGVYIFWRIEDQPIVAGLSRELETRFGRLGWRAIAGADWFFGGSIGLATEYVFDYVWNLHPDVNRQFHGFSIGIVLTNPPDNP